MTRHRKPHPAFYHEEIKPFLERRHRRVLGFLWLWCLEERWPLERQFIPREFADLLEIMA